MRVKVVLLFIVLLLVLVLEVANAVLIIDPPDDPSNPEGPTSLETFILAAADADNVQGRISITNVGEHVGEISEVEVVIEARRNRRWVEVGDEVIAEDIYIDVNDTIRLEYDIQYDYRATDKSYRAVSYVTLKNHPRGERTFISRTSF